MAKHLLALAVALLPMIGSADVQILPDNARLDAAIPSPKTFLGFEPGEWHVRHDQVVAYMRHLAELSPRVTVEQYGETWEKRPLLLVTITAPENHGNLEAIRRDHVAGKRSKLIVWQGFSVHGNEASGTHAALSYAYYLAASQAEDVQAALSNTVVLLDPTINPDGFDRFVNWVNSHKGQSLVGDRVSREHNESWPNGRTNHYWFDLNRDWLLLTHPESRARIKQYQRWRPHVLTDHHEMGSDSTYFFQPGVPERKHPLTPQRNVELTQALAEHHARALDEVGELYYSREQFDDFYYGKGSTYPDIQGTIGILFEQASARGHLMATVNGPLTFRRAIRNQVRTAISTFEGAIANADELMDYQVEFYKESARLASRSETKAYVFGAVEDTYRAQVLADILTQHGIEVYELAQSLEVGGKTYTPGFAFVVPTNQRQYRLLRAVMETRTTFEDTVFYDVSTWTLPLAFGLNFDSLRRVDGVQGSLFGSKPRQARGPRTGAYAHVVSWGDYRAPAVLQSLLDAGVRVRAATQPVVLANGVTLPRGSLVIPRGLNAELEDSGTQVLREVAAQYDVDVYSIDTGLNWQGRDLGSTTYRALKPIRPVLVVQGQVSGYDAGEVWHLLDHRIGLPVVLLGVGQLGKVDLRRYTHLIFVDGTYGNIQEPTVAKIRGWVQAGGTIVSTRRGSDWVTRAGLHLAQAPLPDKPPAVPPQKPATETPSPVAHTPYENHQQDFSLQIIGGAILRTKLDVSHPLGFGYTQDELPVFRQGRTRLLAPENPYQTPVRYTVAPRISGFLATERSDELAETAAVVAQRVGAGSVIRFADNPNFRGFWYGTNRLFLNALFFSQILDATPTELKTP